MEILCKALGHNRRVKLEFLCENRRAGDALGAELAFYGRAVLKRAIGRDVV